MSDCKACCSSLDCSDSNRPLAWKTRHALTIFTRCLFVSSGNFKNARILAIRRNIPSKAGGWVLADHESVSSSNIKMQAEVFELLPTLWIAKISQHVRSRRISVTIPVPCVVIPTLHGTKSLLQLHKSKD